MIYSALKTGGLSLSLTTDISGIMTFVPERHSGPLTACRNDCRSDIHCSSHDGHCIAIITMAIAVTSVEFAILGPDVECYMD